MSAQFEKIKGNFGFGCMRLPMKDGEVDTEEFSRMVDAFLEAGFNYFDTAHGYLDGKSEPALRESLTSRYPRERYVLTDKLSSHFFNSQEEIRPLFQKQLEACGVEYFDFYLMHAQNKDVFEKYKRCRAYETALELRDEGKIRHMGLSFHDKAQVLDQILTEYPQVEVVQIQLNYVDFEDPSVESRKCLEVCRAHGKPAIIMEPVKGGSLVNLPQEAQWVFDALKGGSYASYAIRFAASQEGVMMVLSGMGNMDMMRDNVSYMRDFKPLDDREQKAVEEVCAIFRSQGLIPCTACRYCTERCPKGIDIPALFACMNRKKVFNNWNSVYYYQEVLTSQGTKASDCLKCGRCEEICPQHLKIRELLTEVAAEFEKEDS
ncbi:MAG: aldo/keto reductase [Candidatus Faecousia sp.]|nr:aldo/keto reductase [Candidatus Faecousia sp.]